MTAGRDGLSLTEDGRSGPDTRCSPAVLTGVTNATSESLNRIAKLEARMAYGFRNPENQRRRVRIACTRGTRRRSPTQPASGSNLWKPGTAPWDVRPVAVGDDQLPAMFGVAGLTTSP
jgi:hypothetical protein